MTDPIRPCDADCPCRSQEGKPTLDYDQVEVVIYGLLAAMIGAQSCLTVPSQRKLVADQTAEMLAMAAAVLGVPPGKIAGDLQWCAEQVVEMHRTGN